MATARSLTGVDWLIRTYANALLTACGRDAEAATVRGNQTISTNARLTAALSRLQAMEASCWAEYDLSWDDVWLTIGSKVPSEVLAQCPIPLEEMLADTDANVKLTIKTAFRALGLRATQFVAGGGGF